LPGLWACITASLIIILTSCILDLYFWSVNKKQAKGEYAIEGADVSGFLVALRCGCMY